MLVLCLVTLFGVAVCEIVGAAKPFVPEPVVQKPQQEFLPPRPPENEPFVAQTYSPSKIKWFADRDLLGILAAVSSFIGLTLLGIICYSCVLSHDSVCVPKLNQKRKLPIVVDFDDEED